MILESADNEILQEDLELLLKSGCPFDDLKDSVVFVTGATGLLGSQLVKAIACANRIKELNIKVIAMARSKEKAKKVFGELLDRGDVELFLGDINDEINVSSRIDYIIHGASATSSRYFVTNPVETIFTAIDGTKNVLELAKKNQVKGMIYMSSLEVYGVPQTEGGVVKEADYGYIEPLSTRSSYSEGKRMVECLCASYADEYKLPIKIVRLSQTFGTGVEYDDGRVFAEFARCAVEKRNIVLHTPGRTLRTYCYTRDAVSAIITVLVKGKSGEAYNVTNPDTAITIRDMAQCVCDIYPESDISVEIDAPEDVASFGYNPEMVIRLDTEKIEMLGWKATVGLEEMFTRMIKGF